MRLGIATLAATFGLTLAGTAPAQEPPSLQFPVDCVLGETCFIQQAVDRDPGPGAVDHTCGSQSYDGHTGTDIRVPDFAAMEAGMTVQAAADGIVRAVRDSVPDAGTDAAPPGQGCGNGVVLTHPGGWETQYCHLRLGSVAVAPGMEVTAGTPLGEIGYSGFTAFPHVEFVLRRDGAVVDPFDPSDLAECGVGAAPLWAEPLALSGGGVLSAGFADGVPDYADIQDGTAHNADLSTSGPALVIWGFVYGGRAGDILRLVIDRPDGREFFSQDVELDRTQAQLFRAAGRRISGALPSGAYSGTVSLLRDGVMLDTRAATVALR